jgi:hypothetical protein
VPGEPPFQSDFRRLWKWQQIGQRQSEPRNSS